MIKIAFVINIFYISNLLAQQYDIRIKNQLDKLKMFYEFDSQYNFKLLFELPDKRTQLVYIMSNTNKYEDVEIRQIYSPALLITDNKQLKFEDLYMLLTENSQTIFGGWQIIPHQHGWVLSFVVKTPALMPENRLMMYLWYIAQIADQMEKRFSAEDNL